MSVRKAIEPRSQSNFRWEAIFILFVLLVYVFYHIIYPISINIIKSLKTSLWLAS